MVSGLTYAAEMAEYQATFAERRGEKALAKGIRDLARLYRKLSMTETTEKTVVTLCQSCGKHPSALCRGCARTMLVNGTISSY